MKPLHLTVSGLHSYVEPVSVNLEALGRYGLFGIFGPIGSGKSSLLDALTLALYGLVDRMTGRSRRGIINLESDEVEVRLRFAVSRIAAGPDSEGAVAASPDGGDGGRYEVHRLYRRTATGVQRVTSRLAQLDDDGRPSVVLADKERDVNEAIESLIGLCADDFMRAVVLPQGRFMEVLHLRGSERRKMLQRIFGLHAYGTVVRQRLRQRQGSTREKLAAIDGEITGLGDASPGRVRAALAAENEAAAAIELAASASELANRRFDAAEQARARHVAWREAREALARHQQADAEMAALQARHDRALALRPRVRPARRWLEARAELGGAQQIAARAADAAELANARLHEASATLDEATQAEAGEVPNLRQRLAALEEARRWSIERQALGARVAKLSTEVASQRQRREEAVERLGELQASIKQIDRSRRSVKRKLDQARVDPEEREWLVAATEAHQSVRHARDRLAAEKRRLADVEARCDGLARGVEAREEAAASARHALVAAAEKLAEANARAHDARPDKQEARRTTQREAERILTVAEHYQRQLTSLRDQLQVAEATVFDGGEGLWWFEGVVYLSTKGDNRVWAYDTSTQTITTLYDRDTALDPDALYGVDNLTVSACGDVLVAEDGGQMRIVAVMPDGGLVPLVQIEGQEGSEITGPAFDPSGTRLYFSSQRAEGLLGGITYEITGPFHEPMPPGSDC